MLCRAIAAVLLIGASGQTSAGGGEALTLKSAIALALRENRTIKSSASEVRKFDERLAGSRTRRLPSFSWYALGSQRITALDFRFARGAFGTYQGIGPVPATDTSIRAPLRPAALLIGRVTQPLSQQYSIGLNLHGLSIGREIAQEQDRAQKQAVVNQVKRAYFAILQTQSALASLEESIRLYRELDRVTGEYVSQQAALKSQGLEIKARLAKAEYDALTLRNPLATQKEQLNSLLGRDLQTEFSVSPPAEAEGPEASIEDARRMAAERRPEIRQAKLKLKQAEYDRRIAKAEYIPDVSLDFNYLSPVNYGSLVPSNIAGVGLLVSWEPWDWGRKKHQLSEKSRTLEQAALALQEAESQVTMDVNNRFRKLQEARALLAVVRLTQETGRENLRVITNRYKEQASLLKDVLQAQASLAEADNQYQQALLGYWSAKADFEKALGEEP